MQTIAALLTLVVCFSPPVSAQEIHRVLHFTATESLHNMQEIEAVIRSIADIPRATVDEAEKSMTLRGTAAQIELAEWLFPNLDKSISGQAPQSHNGAKLEFRASDNADDVVRIFYLTNPEIPKGVQEIATAVRSITDIPRMFTYNDLRAIIVRGTAEQLKTTEFLFAEVDKPAVAGTSTAKLQSSMSPEFRLSENRENLVRVFYLPNTKTVREFQEVATLVRSITELRRMFTYYAPRAIAIRGTTEQMALAGWMLAELDRTSSREAHPDSTTPHEYQLSSSRDSLVRIFYLARAATREHLQETAAEIRSGTRCRYVFSYSTPSAIAIRCTPEQIAQAERMIQERDK